MTDTYHYVGYNDKQRCIFFSDESGMYKMGFSRILFCQDLGENKCGLVYEGMLAINIDVGYDILNEIWLKYQ